MLLSALLARFARGVRPAGGRPRQSFTISRATTPPRLEDFRTRRTSRRRGRRRVSCSASRTIWCPPRTHRSLSLVRRHQPVRRLRLSRQGSVEDSGPNEPARSDFQRRLRRRLSRHVQRSSACLHVSRVAARASNSTASSPKGRTTISASTRSGNRAAN